MTTRKRRTPAEIIQDLQAKQAKIQAKLLLSESASNPALDPLVSILKKADREILNFGKGFQNGPQSFQARRESHELWLAEIDAAEAYAEAALGFYKNLKSEVKSAIEDIAQALTKGEDVTERVQATVEALPTDDPQIEALYSAFTRSVERRKNATASKRGEAS